MTNGHVNWLIMPLGYQPITKRCPSCETKKLFLPSGTFRVNAQKKTLDVWNIYKCEKCDYTWNIDIHERINTNKLDPDVHQRYLHNDLDEVRRHAYDYSLLKRNNAELGPTPPYDILGPSPYALSGVEQLSITIDFEQVIPVRLINILTRKLCLSRSQVARLLDEGVLVGLTPADLNRKIKHSLTLHLNLARLYQLDLPFVNTPADVEVS
ncbi:DUF1062 domain-containing protein [Pseudomonas sp. NPDC089554]|uniref:DUF1062 domain-containing protein n=1 Tax=Pseudomonas sp. NPDC089554 TaxID=3390653 RepID=UPI003D093FEC